jgi:DNA helicase-2/ATP-dependent DNA helicase PcrA
LTTTELLQTVQKHTGRALDAPQVKAISHDAGPLWILAGPGSGKTEVLVLHCLKLTLVDGVEPGSILLTTFTEKAARSLQDRLLTRKAAIAASHPWVTDVDVSGIRIGTLHSIANDVMREFRYRPYQGTQLLDELEQLMFIHKNAAIAAGQSGWSKKPPPDDFWVTFGFLIERQTGFYPNRWKRAKGAVDLFNRIVEDRTDIGSMRSASEAQLQRAVELYEDYAHELEVQRCVDFAHMEYRFLSFLDSQQGSLFLRGDGTSARPGVSHVLVDEYQDTNPIQEMIYFKLASRTPHNLSVVGDDEQALYRFRGGDVRCILSFEAAMKNYFKVDVAKVFLNTNYRSPGEIVDFYNHLMLSCRSTRLLREFVGKPSIQAVRGRGGDYPALDIIRGATMRDTALELAGLVRALRKKGMITEYADCALLMRSTRERRPNGNLSEAGEYARALREESVPVYNPRSRAMLEEPEVQLTLGALLEALDSTDRFREFSQNQRFQNMIMQEWRDSFKSVETSSALSKYVAAVRAAIRGMPTSRMLDIELLEIFYNLVSQDPLRQAQDDPEQTLRLSLLSSVLESYGAVYGSKLTTDTNFRGELNIQWKRNFYYSFLDLLISEGMNDFEDREESLPRGRLPIMTFHQSKGLEFPIVFVGSLAVTQDSVRWHAQSKEYALEDLLKPYRTSLGGHELPPSDAYERAEQDTIRLYYVAYSRAQDVLFLLLNDESIKGSLLTITPEMQGVVVRSDGESRAHETKMRRRL